MKKTFKIALPGGVPSDDIPYHPIIFIRGSDAWRLALHQEPVLAGKGDWIVSDPVSGYRVCRVSATYKGLPVASRDLTVPQARAAALADLDTIVDRVGLERFTRVLGEAQKPKETTPLRRALGDAIAEIEQLKNQREN